MYFILNFYTTLFHIPVLYISGHNLLFKSKQEKRLQWEAEQREKALKEATSTSASQSTGEAAVEVNQQLDSG